MAEDVGMAEKAQVKSRERVVEHGEVFTNEREVNAMLDMVGQECERIDSRFLEPACGDGNFLAEILRRKLAVVASRYRKVASDYERHAFVAVCSVYGVDLLEDNAVECRARLLDIVCEAYRKALRKEPPEEYVGLIRYVLGRNILCGDALSLKAENGDPIVFSEWSMVMDGKVKRRDFRLDALLELNDEVPSLFGSGFADGSQDNPGWEYDDDAGCYVALPLREFPVVRMYEVTRYE